MNGSKVKNIVILGSSIAGVFLAFLLSKSGFKVRIFEQKSLSRIGNKTCANIVSQSFLEISKQLNLDPDDFITSKFSLAEFHSQNNTVALPIEDYGIDRKKLLLRVIKKAKKEGAEFHFNTKFVKLIRENGMYSLIIRQDGKKRKVDSLDYVIGADGSLSDLAEQAGLWQKRKFWLAIQTKILKKKLNIRINKRGYNIFFIPKVGYYSYVFPFKKYLIIGVLDSPHNARTKFLEFMRFLGIKSSKIESALIPKPQNIKLKENIFLVGDAGCQTKFTGGGIIPAIKSAFALTEVIVNNRHKKIKELKKEITLQRMVTKILSKMNQKDFDNLLEIAKKGSKNIPSRDELRRWAVQFAFKNPSLIQFLPKLI